MQTKIMEIIGNGEGLPEAIDVYAVAESLHEVFPDHPIEEIALEIAEIAIAQPHRAMLFDKDAR